MDDATFTAWCAEIDLCEDRQRLVDLHTDMRKLLHKLSSKKNKHYDWELASKYDDLIRRINTRRTALSVYQWMGTPYA